MITQYLPSFIRDLKALKKSSAYSIIKQIAFERIPACDSFEQIPDLKKLKGHDQAYRVRVGDYRIGIFISDGVVTFARVQHRRDIYRYFP